MNRLDDIASYAVAQATMVQLLLCLEALDSIDCKLPALHVQTGIDALQCALDKADRVSTSRE